MTTTTDSTSPAARILAGAAVVGGWLAVAVLSWPGTAGQRWPDPGDAAQSPALAAEPLGIGPITFFNTTCGPCHGDYGMLLREQLPADAAGWEAVRGVIRGMVTGQAQTTLPDREIDALAAYRLSLLDGTPYLALTGVSDGALRGEVTPGADVAVLVGEHPVSAAAVDGHTWSAPVPAGEGPITIRATLGGRSAALAIPGVPFSHGAAGSSR